MKLSEIKHNLGTQWFKSNPANGPTLPSGNIFCGDRDCNPKYISRTPLGPRATSRHAITLGSKPVGPINWLRLECNPLPPSSWSPGSCVRRLHSNTLELHGCGYELHNWGGKREDHIYWNGWNPAKLSTNNDLSSFPLLLLRHRSHLLFLLSIPNLCTLRSCS